MAPSNDYHKENPPIKHQQTKPIAEIRLRRAPPKETGPTYWRLNHGTATAAARLLFTVENNGKGGLAANPWGPSSCNKKHPPTPPIWGENRFLRSNSLILEEKEGKQGNGKQRDMDGNTQRSQAVPIARRGLSGDRSIGKDIAKSRREPLRQRYPGLQENHRGVLVQVPPILSPRVCAVHQRFEPYAVVREAEV